MEFRGEVLLFVSNKFFENNSWDDKSGDSGELLEFVVIAEENGMRGAVYAIRI